MKRDKFLKVMILVIILLIGITGCSGYEDSYNNDNVPHMLCIIRAQEMMATMDVLLFDVRSQDSFDSGHIKGAFLLPSHPTPEEMAVLAPDKNQTILLYCERGNTSASTAIILADMGYTNVYDLGSIRDWPGRLVESQLPDRDLYFPSGFYNPPNGRLPATTRKPIDFTVTQQISSEMPEFKFQLTGEKSGEYQLVYSGPGYERLGRSVMHFVHDAMYVHSLRITDIYGDLIQEIRDLNVSVFGFCLWGWHMYTFTEAEMWGLRFEDFNFDGYLDIALQYTHGGFMQNALSYFWLWDSEQGQFVTNDNLQYISTTAFIGVIPEIERVYARTQLNTVQEIIVYYKYVDGDFLWVTSFERGFDGTTFIRISERNLATEEITITYEWLN